jgi:hypothetical protein
MLQLKNASPFAPALSVLPNKDGVDTLYVTVRGTFALLPKLAIAPKPMPPVLTDEYWGDPALSSLKYASELHVGKPTTDVILMGQAWSPGGRVAETSMMVSVANRSKTVKVFGDRTWTATGGFTSPAPFESIPLVYERAFGGSHRLSEQVLLAEERNPVGTGFVGKRSIYEMIGQKLPNFEDPRAPLGRLGDMPPPACFGFVAPSWLPRRSYAGTYDKAWQKKRAPYLPSDFDPRFFSTAPPELTFDRYLQGGEPVQVLGACKQGALRFELPRCNVKAKVKIAGAQESPPFHLETVLIEPDDNRLSLSWRAQLICDKKVLKIEEVTIDVAGLDLPSVGSP